MIFGKRINNISKCTITELIQISEDHVFQLSVVPVSQHVSPVVLGSLRKAERCSLGVELTKDSGGHDKISVVSIHSTNILGKYFQ